MCVDLNVRNGRRMLNFGDTSAATTQTARVRSTRTKEASMSKLEDLHLDAMWCSAQIVEGMHKSDFEIEARDMDLKNIIPVTLDPEELEAEIATWNVSHNPPPEHTMDLFDAKDPEAVKANEEKKAAKKLVAAAKRKDATKKKPKKPAKTKAKPSVGKIKRQKIKA